MIIIPDSMICGRQTESMNLAVTNVGYTNVPDHWQHKQRFTYARELIYVTEGNLFLKVGHQYYDLHDNEYLPIPPFSSMVGSKPSPSQCSFYTIVYEGTLELPGHRELTKRKVTGNLFFITELLRHMRNIYDPRKKDNTELDTLFLNLLFELNRAEETKANTGLPLQKVIDYIHSNIHKEISMDDLCREFNYSSDYITRIFRESYGITIKKYINQVKMDTAKRLLSTSQLTIRQVAGNVGFDDVSLFYKYFRYHEKITPTEYRKRYG